MKPDVIKAELIDRERIDEIVNEFDESKTELLITLGGLLLRHIVRHFNSELVSLSSFEKYGQIHDIKIGNKEMLLLPVVQLSQAWKKGKYSRRWYGLHNYWIEKHSPN